VCGDPGSGRPYDPGRLFQLVLLNERAGAIYRLLIKSLMTGGKRSSTLILCAPAGSNQMDRHSCAYTAIAVHVKASSLTYAAITPEWHAATSYKQATMFRRMIFTASFFLALCSPDTVSATSALAMIQKTGFCAGSNGKDTIKARNAALGPCRKKRSDFPLYVTSSYIERGQFFSCASVDGGPTGFAQEFESTQNAADNAAIQACEQLVGWKKDQKGLLRQRCKITYRLPGCSP
jgi:hypothetical protein